MPVTSTAERSALPQEMTEHYANAIAILELHLDKGQEQLTADAIKAKEALDRVSIYQRPVLPSSAPTS